MTASALTAGSRHRCRARPRGKTAAGLVTAVVVMGSAALLALGAEAWAEPAFPGAEGFGATATGGVGGREIWVTTLAPDGPGSLREAVDAEGPRIVKFAVAGTIELRERFLRIGSPFRAQIRAAQQQGRDPGPSPQSDLTIDGSSAPPPGITISGNVHIGYNTCNVILRHLRIRDNGYLYRSMADCITITDGCYRIMVDHCSLTGARDEVVNPWGRCGDITFQWCIFQAYGPHGFGPLNGAGSDRITYHHCLFAHNMARNPLITGNIGPSGPIPGVNPNPIVDMRNNLIYNWFNVSGTQIDNAARANVVGNRYIAGPNSDATRICIVVQGDAQARIEGNISPNRPDASCHEWADAGHHARDQQGVYQGIPGPWEHGMPAEEPFPAPTVTTQPAEEAAELVLMQVGAWPRDPIDAGIVRTVLDRTGWACVPNTRPEDYRNGRPQAQIAVTGAGTHLDFAGTGSDPEGYALRWSWDFGDGAVALGQRVAHQFPAPGRYLVTVYAMDARGMTSASRATVTANAEGPPLMSAEQLPDWRDFPPPPAHEDHPWVTVRVPRIEAVPGFPEPAAWQTAARLTPFLMQEPWRPVPEAEIDARVLHDGERLLVRVDSLTPGAAQVRTGEWAGATGAERWYYQGLEMCLAPHWGVEPWFQFVINTNGETRDARGFDLSWAPAPLWAVRSSVTADRWVLELAVPLAAIGSDGSTCALKLARYREKNEILIWPPLGAADGQQWCRQTPEPDGYALLELLPGPKTGPAQPHG